MAAGRIVISEFAPARDRNDALVAGAKMFVYTNGTTTLASIYTSAALTTALANPVVANSSGQFAQVWADASLIYTVSITGPNGESIGNPSVFDDYSPSTNFAVSQVEEYKAPVRVASTANITIASALINGSTIDGVVVATGDRVLLKDQSTGSQNGIYVVVASGAAMRAGDADTSAKVLSGMTMFVSEGTANGGAVFTLTTANPIVLGTTALVFSRYAGIGILPIANGGTGSATADGALTNFGGTTVGKAVFTAANAAAARTATGTVIGTDVQAYDPDLTTWAGITPGTGVGTALAINVGSAGAFTTFNGAGGTPSSMTLTNATGLPIAGLVSSTSTALGVGSLELGNASDTTLARSSAGNVTIEGNLIYRAGGTDVPITDGGTGSSTADDARTALAVVGTADLAASTGAALVGSINVGTGATARTVQAKLRDTISAKDFNAKGDGKGFLDGAITSGTPNFVSASSTFTAGDVGKAIFIDGAGAAGATLVTTISAYVSATAVTLAANASTTVSGADGNYGTDDTAAINAALTYAGSLSITRPVYAEYGWVLDGGATVEFPAGLYMCTAEIVVPYAVSVEGAGKNSTVFRSSATEAVMRNFGSPIASGDYSQKGMAFRNFSISGMRSKTSQVGLGFLRVVAATIENVLVERCGSHGLAMYEASVNNFSNFESVGNVGAGIYMTYGFNSWADRTGAQYPCNANSFYFVRCLQNDAAGILLAPGTNGNTFYNANSEYNYASSAANTGYNVHVTSDAYAPNSFYDLWTEGGCEAHVYLNCTALSVSVRLFNWKHFGNGTSGNVDRAIIINAGNAVIENAVGSSVSYKTLSGSNSPFRIQNKTNGAIRVRNCVGSTVSGLALVDDSTGSRTGLYNNFKQDNSMADGSMYGQYIYYNDGGGGDGVAYRNDNQNHAWYQSRAFYKDILLGDGASAPDAGFMRVAANQLGPRAGDFFNVGSAWNGSHLVMGSYHLWVDATGDLRIVSGAPARDTDGTVVGAQT
jgi:hypothetical protein